jgi:hypothetical protein
VSWPSVRITSASASRLGSGILSGIAYPFCD